MNNPPAFPFVEPPTTCNVNSGITICDYFAAAALTGMYANSDIVGAYDTRTLADFAIEVGKAMLAAREAPTPKEAAETP